MRYKMLTAGQTDSDNYMAPQTSQLLFNEKEIDSMSFKLYCPECKSN